MLSLKRPVLVACVAAFVTAACDGNTSSTAVAPLSPSSVTTLGSMASSSATTSSPSKTPAGRTSCATGDGVNDACACNTDSRTYCGGFYSDDWESYACENGYTTASWKYGLIDCLGKHTISAACRASLDRREMLNERMMSACATYCKGTTPRPGAEPCVDHLKSIYESLDNACRTALDAHEAAKALQGQGPF